MNTLIGNAPRHPGLWMDMASAAAPVKQGIETKQTANQGLTELTQLCGQLAVLSQQGRWIVLINPPHIGYKQILANANVRMDRVLLVHTKDEVETLWAMEKALTSGTSSAVITWTTPLDARDNRRIQLVAKSALAQGVIIEDVNTHLRDDQLNASNPVTATQLNLSAFH
ncbi:MULTISPECIES: cell division inhibitor SulA [Shewanella]|uniref:cell division inhibitor SulA n=1 Tax=Shewanella TaxID=22 RepID=UPI0006D6631F|nr:MULTISPECIES: SulA-like leucine-rich domain-containing protein [Shewanella]KPZ69469.1 Cell division inhibitor SulA [Shewanella sp. P1-14-1]MBQ4890224.1 cell division protein [Shewanella sp. MMG014]OBT05396.1 cell division protein [Shewanella sp. UCD-FRSSP16_17]